MLSYAFEEDGYLRFTTWTTESCLFFFSLADCMMVWFFLKEITPALLFCIKQFPIFSIEKIICLRPSMILVIRNPHRAIEFKARTIYRINYI